MPRSPYPQYKLEPKDILGVTPEVEEHLRLIRMYLLTKKGQLISPGDMREALPEGEPAGLWAYRLDRIWRAGLVDKYAHGLDHWRWHKPWGIRYWIWRGF